jgi:hypothetical protein
MDVFIIRKIIMQNEVCWIVNDVNNITYSEELKINFVKFYK